MSRTSRKSDLSPSITKGSDSGLDLGKNSGVDMGRKTEVSNTSGGIGITQEVGKVGGVGVSLGVGVDVTPLDFGISANPSEGTISVAGGGEVPGGLLGVSGGVTIDTNTGRIIGGSIGGEIGGLGINISNSEKGGLGVEFTLQIPGTPIEFSLGLGFPAPEEPKLPSTPTSPGSSSPTNPGPFPPGSLPKNISSNSSCTVVVAREYKRWVDYEIFLEHTHWTSTGSAQRDDEGYLKISGSYSYVLPAGGTFEFADIPPNWKETSLNVSYFSYGGLYGASGLEGAVYDEINRTSSYYYDDGTQKVATTYKVIFSDCPLTSSLPPSPPSGSSPLLPRFPNPPPRRQRKMDVCCQENLKLLRDIYTKLGLAKFPGKLPSTIIQETQKEGEAPPEPPSVPIPDLTSLLMWQFERDDERWGQWQVEIDIKDSDITKEGDQKKPIKFPNLAESIAEFEGQLLSILTNVDALVALQVKNLAESGMARQEAIKGYLAAKAIIKYMAFKSTEVDVPVPMTFTAGAETISELLKESEGHIKGTDYTEKETLRDVYLDLLQAAAIIRAVHWHQIDTKSDTKSQLLSILKGSVDLAASITKPQSPNGNGEEKTFDPEKDFEDFIDNVEDGFRNTTGITDGQNPYGKPPAQRPRIRQIGDNISQAGKS
jgi:hypothetical protein